MKTLILGLDAFDPAVFERLYEQGRMPNLGKLVESKAYSRFAVSNPAQSEVSWTSIATGSNPGVHGMFDFVHRNPADYSLSVSLLPTKKVLAGTEFTNPVSAATIFDEATRLGYPATALWWPATFPARPGSPVATIPGLGTPDIRGRLGVGTFYSLDGNESPGSLKTAIEPLAASSARRYVGRFVGPYRGRGGGSDPMTLRFVISKSDDGTATMQVGDEAYELVAGKWSPMIELRFRAGLAMTISAITRVILSSSGAGLELYALPLQIHPLRPIWPYGSPKKLLKRIWRDCGPFLTVGWPQDTTGLEEGFITDEDFLALCDQICASRESILFHQLASFKEGILAAVFDSLDRVQHMFWRDRPDVVEAWYEKLDGLVGRVMHALANDRGCQLLIISDHGFAAFDKKVHLNGWLVEHGYLTPSNEKSSGNLRQIDWCQTSAYAVGLNSLYLNVRGREADGQVEIGHKEAVLEQLALELLGWRDPQGRAPVSRIWHGEEVFHGPLAGNGPDLVVGYAPGYRASAETGLGEWSDPSLEDNLDHWAGDHCIDPGHVPGVIFSIRGLHGIHNPTYLDIPNLAGIQMRTTRSRLDPPPPESEDLAEVEERLRSLGYL